MTDTIPEVLSKINERWENLTIADDFVFCKAMLNADLCREVLEAVLGVAIERIDYIGRQEDLDASPAGKGIRLDVYVRDGAGTPSTTSRCSRPTPASCPSVRATTMP